jgi:acyl-CoA synthetase (AMP-forming)/AMP-acid ligase II
VSLWDELTRETTLRRTIWEWDDSAYRETSYADLVDGARRAAAGLRRRGVQPGDVVPAVITNGPAAIRGVTGIWFAGATVASLPIPARGMTIPNYVAQLGRLCASLDAKWLLADDRVVAIAGDLDVDVIDYASLTATEERLDIEPPPLDGVVFIQFSSGTTGEPRGVELTGRAIERQVHVLAERQAIDPERDFGGTWLPMSHDMGFIGAFVMRWYSGISGFRSPPERFLQAPQTWLDDCARFGTTITGVPPFALALAARAEKLRPSTAKLALRLCAVGAERIDWSVLTAAADTLGPRGLGLDVLTPGYGLAENTLAVTLADLDAPPRYLDVDAEALAEGTVRVVDPGASEGESARRLVSCGTPLEGVGVRIDGASGEIVVAGPSLGLGYHRNPEATRARFRDGELWTADLGFMRDGELYVVGRTDDVLIVGGRNVHVKDVETALSAESGVRTGNCAIVDVPRPGGADIALVAELDGESVDARALSARLRKASLDSAGVPIDRFVFLPRGKFPKTPSGKAQRYRCRSIAQRPDVAIEVVDLGVSPDA